MSKAKNLSTYKLNLRVRLNNNIKNLFSKENKYGIRKESNFKTFFKWLLRLFKKNSFTRFFAKQKAIKMVRFWQSGPKKSDYELMQLAYNSGLMRMLHDCGVKTDWYQMKFLN